MSSSPGLPEVVLDLWRFTARGDAQVLVLPDGCRDLIVRVSPGAAPRSLVSPLADGADTVSVSAGEQLVGLRLQAGAQLDDGILLARLAAREHLDDDDLLAAVAAQVRLDPRVRDALACLAEAPGVARACRQLGVAERSLQRLLAPATGRSPGFWNNLARARRSARALGGHMPLAQVAADHGYADQAHLTRDMRRWFGATPTAMRRHAARFAALHSSGHG